MAELHQYEGLARGLAVLQGPLGHFLLDPLDGLEPSATECPGRRVAVWRDGSLWPDAAIHLMEGRVPLLDHRVVEYCCCAPVAFRIQGYDKFPMRTWLSRRQLLPEKVIFRTDKKGFPTFFETLLKGGPAAVAQLWGRLDGLLGRAPNVLGRATVMALIGEQETDGIDNAAPTAWLPS